MVVPFGISIGDFLEISKLIGRIVVELKKSSEAASDYQLLVIELETLDRTLKALERLAPVTHDARRLSAIKALASTCQLPLQEFLTEIEKFEPSLGSWNARRRTFSSLAQRVQWSVKYRGAVQVLREKLAPNLATITLLLITQNADYLSMAESSRIRFAQEVKDMIYSQSAILSAVEKSTSRVVAAQDQSIRQYKHLTEAAVNHERNLQSLNHTAQELLKSNSVLETKIQEQGDVLGSIRRDIGAAPLQGQADVETVSCDKVELKADISSMLVPILDVLGTITTGLSKVQDLLSTMHQMLRLTVRFTLEMRETLGRLLQAFWVIHQQITRLEGLIGRQISLPIVIFRDAFNNLRPFPYDLSREWSTFEKLVAVAFTGQQGLHRVKMGQYFVTNVRIDRRLNPSFWSSAIQPGDELSMTMILDDISSEEGVCPYRSCGASTDKVPSKAGGKVCPNCFRFAAIEETRNPTLEEAVEVFRHLSLRQRRRLMGPSPARVREREDVELYHSIQVAKALSSLNASTVTGHLSTGLAGTHVDRDQLSTEAVSSHPNTNGMDTSWSVRKPVEFQYALDYIERVKARFVHWPKVYREFLEVLKTYQRSSRPIDEVFDSVSRLFVLEPDLVEEFKVFLPEDAEAAGEADGRTYADEDLTSSMWSTESEMSEEG
ncbi:Transcriptional regulatory protein sin3 [Cladophialophora chaetospira]|uniref:Transcriptional regulatory protein sin3 n=1 Tax=Cladophialophora chaetospira TaxID=386627 RepID=A0AA38XAG9_9EURO|nr:Transcriptional regulatory protein sin3 [Cladophialophora chaetospira]